MPSICMHFLLCPDPIRIEVPQKPFSVSDVMVKVREALYRDDGRERKG